MWTQTDSRTMSVVTLMLLFYAIGRAFDAALSCVLIVATHVVLYVVRYQESVSWSLPDGTIVTITYCAPRSALVSMMPIDGRVPLEVEFVLSDEEKEVLGWKRK